MRNFELQTIQAHKEVGYAMTKESLNYQFHIHHILPKSAFNLPEANDLINQAGIYKEGANNKIGLYSHSSVADQARATIQSGDRQLLEAGFGGSLHPGAEKGFSHKGYNDFARKEIELILQDFDPYVDNSDDAIQSLQNLHQFLTNVSQGRIGDLGVPSSAADLSDAFGAYDPQSYPEIGPDYTNQTIGTDPLLIGNTEARLDQVERLLDISEQYGPDGHYAKTSSIFNEAKSAVEAAQTSASNLNQDSQSLLDQLGQFANTVQETHAVASETDLSQRAYHNAKSVNKLVDQALKQIGDPVQAGLSDDAIAQLNQLSSANDSLKSAASSLLGESIKASGKTSHAWYGLNHDRVKLSGPDGHVTPDKPTKDDVADEFVDLARQKQESAVDQLVENAQANAGDPTADDALKQFSQNDQVLSEVAANTLKQLTLFERMVTADAQNNQLPQNLSDLGDDFIQAITANPELQSIAVRAGFVGDSLEFLNYMYDSLKNASNTGDYSQVVTDVVTFGEATALGTVVVIGTIAAASIIGPNVAAVTAAAWTAKGIYDGAVAGVELVQKVVDDFGDLYSGAPDGYLNFNLSDLFNSPWGDQPSDGSNTPSVAPDDSNTGSDGDDSGSNDGTGSGGAGNGGSGGTGTGGTGTGGTGTGGGSGSTATPPPSDSGSNNPIGRPQPLSPLVLDLKGDGFSLTHFSHAGVYFDLDVDGNAELTGWVGPEDGLLALDLDQNGWIDSGAELFGDQTGFAHGFLALAEHDVNQDGVINASDAVFDDLRVWTDHNQDGFSQADELHSLQSLNITSLSLASQSIEEIVLGNDILYTADFTMSDGSSHRIGDVFFDVDQTKTLGLPTTPLGGHAHVPWLPLIDGSGTIISSWQAMSENDALRIAAEDLIDLVAQGQIRSFQEAFEDFLYLWAGVDEIETNSRGPAIDARKLSFAEKWYQDRFEQDDYAYFNNPGPVAALVLDWQLSDLMDELAARFLSQALSSHIKINSETSEDAIASILAHPLRHLPNSQDTIETFGWIADILEDSASGRGLDLEDAKALFTILKPYIQDQSTYEAALKYTYETIFGATEEATAFASDILQERGLYVTDGAIDENVPGHIVEQSVLIHTDENQSETLQGGAGDDVLVGREGSDNYIWGSGMGNDVTDEEGDGVTIEAIDQDKLILTNLNPNDVRFVRMPEGGFTSDLLIEVIATGEWLLLDDQLSGHAYENIEIIQFADGTELSKPEFEALAYVWQQGSDAQDTLNGTSIQDHIDGGTGDDTILGGQSNDKLIGGSGADHVNGEDGHDWIMGDDGYDTLEGGDGMDSIHGGTGNDTLNGGNGSDSYYYALGDGWDWINESGGSSLNTNRLILQDIRPEDIYIRRNAIDLDQMDLLFKEFDGRVAIEDQFAWSNKRVDEIHFEDGTVWFYQDMLDAAVTGNTRDNTLYGFSANDVIVGHEGSDHLYGLDGDDTIFGGTGHDFIEGGDDDDSIAGGDGNDTLSGGFGSDQFDGGEGDDTVTFAYSSLSWSVDLSQGKIGGENAISIENIIGGSGNDTIAGDAKNNILEGNSGDDHLIGEAGDDVIIGGDGDDSLWGGDGDDRLIGGTGLDSFDGGLGRDVIDLSARTNIWTVDLALGSMNGEIIQNIEDIIGGQADDTINGDAHNNRLDGQGGDDMINAGAGDDSLVAGHGHDTIDGGEGEDTIILNALQSDTRIHETIEGDLLIDANGFIQRVTNIEKIQFSDGALAAIEDAITDTLNIIRGTDGDDDLRGSDNTIGEILSGMDGDDQLRLYAGNDTGFGGEGHDSIWGYDGRDSIDGGDGNDLVSGNDHQDTVHGGAGNDRVYGGGDSDLLFGDEGADTVWGSTGHDTLSGGLGNDTLYGWEGDDVYHYNLGDGHDFIDEDSSHNDYNSIVFGADISADDVIVRRVQNDTKSMHITFANQSGGIIVHDHWAYSTHRIDEFNFSDGTRWIYQDMVNAGANGTEGDDWILLNSGSDWSNGRGGNDTLLGAGGQDTLYGGDGDDWIDGETSNNSLYGGHGNDILVTKENRTDYLDGGDGVDTVDISQSSVNWYINLTDNNVGNRTAISIENIFSSSGDDTIIGSDADNLLEGRNGNDSLSGGAGNDTLVGGLGSDSYDGGEGIDTISLTYSSANWTVNMITQKIGGEDFISIENIIGSRGNDTITGDDGDNQIDGYSGNDLLFGGEGNDTIIGGVGDDTLKMAGMRADYTIIANDQDGFTFSGLDGVDQVFGVEWIQFGEEAVVNITSILLDETITTPNIFIAQPGDSISGFNAEQGDQLDISSIDADVHLDNDQAFQFIAEDAFASIVGELRFDVIGGDTILEGDTDGDGLPDFSITVIGVDQLNETHFIL